MRSSLTLCLTMLCATPALAGRTLYTNTRYVEDVAVDRATAWVATRGGLEEYDLASHTRRHLYTTEHGLTSNWIKKVAVGDGAVWLYTDDAICAFAGGTFGCEPTPSSLPEPTVGERRFQGARVTASATSKYGELIGTSAGLFLQRDDAELVTLTAADQICSNHVVAVAEWRGRTWFGSFDEGLCSHDGEHFADAAGGFHMINDLLVAGDALWVASSEGLFRSTDGVAFEKLAAITDAVSDLAYDEHRGQILATTNAALWRMDRDATTARATWRPGGTRSLQAVAVHDGDIWLASEDRGAMRVRGKKVTVFDRASGLPSSWATDVAVAEDGTAYVATLRHGLAMVSGKAAPAVVPGLPDAWLLAVANGKRGSLLVGTQLGAARITTHHGKRTVASLGPVPNPCVHALYDGKTATIIGTEGGTLVLGAAPLKKL